METYLGNEEGAFHPACLEKELLHPHSMGEEALLGEKEALTGERQNREGNLR